MSNNPAFKSIEVDFDALLLDLGNPRIYAWRPSNQAEAITAIMEARGDHTYNLAKDIAQNGLGTPPIIVMPFKEEGKFVVMDGNRRIAAMKILANPDLAPEKYRKRLSEAAHKHDFDLPEKLMVSFSTDSEAVAREIMRLHTGEQEGVGQVAWSPLEQEMFAYRHDLKLKYDLATKFLIAANHLGVTNIHSENFIQKFPITTLGRFLTKERLNKIGIDVSTPENPTFFGDNNVVKFRMRKIITDMLKGKVHVSAEGTKKGAKSIRNTDDQKAYLQEVLQEDHSGKTFVPETTNELSTAGIVQKQATTRNVRPTPSDPYDRKRLIPRGKTDKLGISIDRQAPDKVQAVYRELTKLNLEETPMAAAILCRTFLELAVDLCIEKHNIKAKQPKLASKMQACAAHLFGKESDGYKKIAPLWGEHHFLSVRTLHQIVHASNFPASNRDVCMFWEQLLPFLRACLE